MKNTISKLLIFIFIIAFFNAMLLDRLYDRRVKKIDFVEIEAIEDADKIADFDITDQSISDIKAYCEENKLDFIEFFSAYMKYNNYEVDSVSFDYDRKYYKKVEDTAIIEDIYRMILADIKYFPIPENKNEDNREYWYCNSWRAERTYGGEREHYGTDIIDSDDEKGYFPIVSMTDGYVEKIGWLELGGWRIGIRAEHGGYFYYAHMEKYAKGIKEGSKVKAGDLIGYMGDTGYGEEGTCGKFQVHLHLGIALPVGDKTGEFWINPYWLLRYIEGTKILKSY